MDDLLDQILCIIKSLKDDEHKLQQILDYLETEVVDEYDYDNPMANVPEKYKPLINEIAQYIDMDMLCFVNPETAELDFIPQEIYFESNYDDDPEEIKKELIEQHGWEVAKFLDWKESIDFVPLPSFESFQIMEDYVQQLPEDEKLLSRLINALRNRKPFANFGRIIDNSDLRENWFEFKQSWLEKLVARELLEKLENLKQNNNEI